MSMTGTAQAVLPPQSGEYAIVGRMPGDQLHPHLALKASGGFLVWEENTGENGTLMVLGEPLTATLTGAGANTIMPVSLGVAGDNQNAQTALLQDGGKVVVWQGGQAGFQKVYARFITADNQFATAPMQVNTFTNNEQGTPVVAVLTDGSVFVAWTSIGQDGDKAGVFARRLTASGQFSGGEFQVNQFTDWNQRDPAVAALDDGNVAVIWISEQQRAGGSADVYGRFFRATGEPVANEFLVNDGTGPCASPAIAPLAKGGFAAVWSRREVHVSTGSYDTQISTNSWDIYGRVVDASGVASAASTRVNGYTYGDQVFPSIAAVGGNQLVVWTSLLQDGDWEGVFGRALSVQGTVLGDEFRVNTTTVNRQLHPVVAGNGAGQALAVWTSAGMGVNGFDLMAQVYGNAGTIESRLTLVSETQGWRLEWTTQAGSSYQVQVSSNFEGWSNVGAARMATGDTDSVMLTPSAGPAYYRIVILP